jgi:ADP-ribose pyrophosphatase YjhB (NUDIX family)
MTFTLSKTAQQSVKTLLDRCLLDTNLPPQIGSKPLYIANLACGWVHPQAVLALNGLEGVRINDNSVVVSCDMSNQTNEAKQANPMNLVNPNVGHIKQQESLNALLANVALRLKEAGCCVAWRNELLDVWADDQSIAAIERGVVRPLGLTTRAVHLHARHSSGSLWVAQRALNKPTDPGMWDTLVGGLVGYGESDDLALVRETEEEAGLSPEQIKYRTPIRQITVMQRQLPEGYQIERVLSSECVLADDCMPANQDGEVIHIRCIKPSEIVDMLHAKAFTTEATIVIAEDLVRRG